VHDADTLVASIDLGFYLTLTVPVRLLGINAPELNTPAGKGAAAFLTALLPAGTEILLASEKPDKYAPRVLARVMLDGKDIAETLIAAQWAAAWDGRGIKPLPVWPRTIP
jgi:endonuclease YncB( thermonuclease family)